MKARSHTAAGITRSISEPVFAKDILSDINLALCGLKAWGGWMKTLLYLWDGKKDRLSYTVEDWSKVWRCSFGEARAVILELAETNTCRVEVTTVTGTVDVSEHTEMLHVIESNSRVTLVSRRLERRQHARNEILARVQRHRKRKRNAPVTPKVAPSSISSSSSPSASAKGEEKPPPVSEPAWARKKAAKEELDRLRLKQHPTPEEVQKMRELKAIISACNDEIAGVKKK